jgi:hypothetical protein
LSLSETAEEIIIRCGRLIKAEFFVSRTQWEKYFLTGEMLQTIFTKFVFSFVLKEKAANHRFQGFDKERGPGFEPFGAKDLTFYA